MFSSFNIYLSLFIACVSMLTADAMEKEADLLKSSICSTSAKNVASPSLQDILVGLTKKELPLIDRIKMYNPTKTLKDVCEDLFSIQKHGKNTPCESVQELVLKGIFAIHFHGILDAAIPNVTTDFLNALIALFPCRGKSKNPFLKVPGTNPNQREVLSKYFKAATSSNMLASLKQEFIDNSLLNTSFSDKDPSLKNRKAAINLTLSSFQSEIEGQFNLQNKIPYIFSNNLFLKISLTSLEYALRFGSGTAVKMCESVSKNYFNMTNVVKDQILSHIEVSAELGAPWAMRILGLNYKMKGKMVEAEENLTAAANLDDALAMGHLGDFYKELGELEKAKEWYRKAIKKNHIGAISHLGFILSKEGKFKEAENFYRTVLKCDKLQPETQAQLMSNLGELYLEQNRKNDAEICFRNVAEFGKLPAIVKLGILLFNKGETNEAKDWFTKAAKRKIIDPVDVNTKNCIIQSLQYLEVIYLNMENLVEAEQWGKVGESLGDACSITNLGVVYYRQGLLNRAIEYFEKAETLGNIIAKVNLGILYFYDKNELDKAETLLTEAAKLGNPVSIESLGIISFNKGKLDEAQKYAFEAFNYGYNRALLLIAQTYRASGDFEKSESYYKKAIGLGVEDAEIFYAQFLSMMGRPEESSQYQEFHEGNISQNEMSIETDEVLTNDKENSPQIDTITPTSTQPFDKSPIEVKENIPTISKKLQRYIDRAEKRQKDSMLQLSSPLKETKKPKSYKDFQVFVLSDASADATGTHQTKIQYLISSLANGERRGRFEPLDGHKDVYSMRLTGGDRLVVKITDGDITNGVKSLTILAAKGHYKTLTPELVSKTGAAVQWKQTEDHSALKIS